jgi:hypothetical protein
MQRNLQYKYIKFWRMQMLKSCNGGYDYSNAGTVYSMMLVKIHLCARVYVICS